MQMYQSLNLLDAWPIQPSLQLSEHLAPVHEFPVMVPVQELRRLPAADARGGPVWALPRGNTRPAREPLTLPGAVSAHRTKGGRAAREGEGGYAIKEGGAAGRKGGRTSGGTTQTGVRATSVAPAARQPQETMSL